MSLPKIFVQIASYRDPECQWTVRDLFEKAAHPERISVGICWQFDPQEDAYCFMAPNPYPERTRIIQHHWRDSKGVGWARAQTQKLWQGEEYTLQIDSHMRFESEWDNKLISMLGECNSKKPVLSTYPPGYTLTHGSPLVRQKLDRGFINVLRAEKFDQQKVLSVTNTRIDSEKSPSHPQPSPFLACGFLFAKSEIIKEAPYDPNFYFWGEEPALNARLWTNGWDIFYPNQTVVYHLYAYEGTYDDFPSKTWALNSRNETLKKQSANRAKIFLGMKNGSIPEIERYGLGKERTLEEYQEWSGINFKERTISEQAKTGLGYKPFRRAFASVAL